MICFCRSVNLRWLIMVAILIVGPVAGAQEQDSPADLPLLVAEQSYGTTFFGTGMVPEDDRLLETMANVAEQGMTAFTFYVDMTDLETAPGVYDLTELEASLAWLHGMGIQPLLNITLVDVDAVTLPEDLTLNDPALVTRVNDLLTAVVPLLVDHGGFLLLLGNEVDEYLMTAPEAEVNAYTDMIASARTHVQSLEPQLAVGVTLTGTQVLAEGTIFQALQPVTDVVSFNYYPLHITADDWFTVLPLEAIPDVIAQFMTIYADQPVIITELGCPSSTVNGSSPEHQAACFEALFEALDDYPGVRYVTVFTLYDWDEATCDLVTDLLDLGEDVPDFYHERWRGYLCTLGLLNADYTPKPAWQVFLERLQP